MKPPSPDQFLRTLQSLDWSGHMELGDHDLRWLAGSLAAAFSTSKDLCGCCGSLHEIIIRTPLGPICEDCLSEASEEAEETREILEGKAL